VKKIISTITVGALAASGLALMVSSASQATPSDKVTICHATASTTNPYTAPEVNTSSVDEEKNQYLNGHGDHTGPVFDPAGGKDQPAWGDIIPPFESPIGTKFPGYNWTEAGQAIYNNGCQPVIPTPTPTPTETTPTPTPTETTPTPTPTETTPTPTPTETVTVTPPPVPTATVTVTPAPLPVPTVTVTETPEPEESDADVPVEDTDEPEPVNEPVPVPTEIDGGL
jgi:hypothetical protein